MDPEIPLIKVCLPANESFLLLGQTYPLIKQAPLLLKEACLLLQQDKPLWLETGPLKWKK
jgi:hypothetical protein